MKQVPLTIGRGYRPTELFAMVDGEDYGRISQWVWSPRVIGGIAYAVRQEGTSRSKNHSKGYSAARIVLMHREILDAGPDQIVDHANLCGLDNRRENLRFTNRQGNAANAKKKEGTSRFKGVFWDAARGKWMARVTVDYRGIFLGRFSDEIEAGRAYDDAACHYFGEFARTNFPIDKGD
jgi:hypothetical protein